MLITLVLLALARPRSSCAASARRSGIAVGLVAVYLALNLVVVVGRVGRTSSARPSVVPDWTNALTTNYSSIWMMIGIALLVFPKLALGLSGFETGVAVMPQVGGRRHRHPGQSRRPDPGHQAAADHRRRHHERLPDHLQHHHHPADPAGGVPAGRRGQRPGAGLPGARVPRQRLRHRLRRCRRSPSCGSPVPPRWPGCSTWSPATSRGTAWHRNGRRPSGRWCWCSPPSPSW